MLVLERISTTADVIAALREADRLTAAAAAALARGVDTTEQPMPIEFSLRLDARRTRWAASELAGVADALRRMPHLRRAARKNVVSWSQCQAIVRAVRDLRVDDHATVDALIGRRAEALMPAEPDRLVCEVEDLCGSLRADLVARREERAIETSFLVLRPKLTGGGSLYGEADAERFAAIAESLDAYADEPIAADTGDDSNDDTGDDVEATHRARQRMDALAHICEMALAGDQALTRPRPRLLATMDLASGTGQILWGVQGKSPRLTPLSTEVLSCDAELVPIVFDGAKPIAVGDAYQTVAPKLRTAVVARDGGCRFPGCAAPASWSDVHHIKWLSEGGGNEVENLILLCRRCHRRVHGRRWQIKIQDDGTADFRLRGRRYLSPPRVPTPRLE